MSRIAVIGGHGKVALHLGRILTERGHQVSAIVRNPTHRDDVEATGAEAVVADVEGLDVDGMAEVLAGHDAVVWSAGAGGGDPERTYAVDRDAASCASPSRSARYSTTTAAWVACLRSCSRRSRMIGARGWTAPTCL